MSTPIALESTINDALASRRDEALDFLAECVRCPSVTGDETLVAPLYRRWFAERGWTVDAQSVPNITDEHFEAGGLGENVIGYLRHPSGRDLVVINGHIDVVPVHDAAIWDRDPFSGTREDGHVHGRGSVDTKGGIASALLALDVLDSLDVDLGFDVALELVIAEETVGEGTRTSLRLLPERKAAVVLEPTGGAVVPVASGLLFFTIELSGRAAHTSVPWHGVDATTKLLMIYDALEELGKRRAEEHRHPLMSDLPSSVPLAIGTLASGGWRASVPAQATMSGRIGVSPEETLESVRQELADCVIVACAGDAWLSEHPATLRWDHDGCASWYTDPGEEIVRAMLDGAEAMGDTGRLEGMTAGCDAGQLSALGIPTIVYGPGDMRFAHSPDERIAEDDVVHSAGVLVNALLALSESALSESTPFESAQSKITGEAAG